MDTAKRMSDRSSSKEMERLAALVPLHTLPEAALGELMESVSLESIGKGQMLFEEGDTDHQHIYLLEGTSNKDKMQSISERVVEEQSLDVDTISGATVSQKVALKAIENALEGEPQ